MAVDTTTAPTISLGPKTQTQTRTQEITTTHNDNETIPEPTYDIKRYRSLVPVAEDPAITYLNASFQPPVNLVVRDAITAFLAEGTTQPHPKPTWQERAEETRTLLGSYINAPPSSLAITRDTTEGLNLFQRSIAFEPGDNIVILDSEHPNHAYGWFALQASAGLIVRQVPTDPYTNLHANAATFEPYVDSRTRAIGISSIMFHSGQLNDVQDICARFRPRGIHVVVDMTQHVGVAPIDVTRWGISAAAFGLHKGLGSLSGLGFLYIEPATLETLKPVPPIVGAGAIENLSPDLLALPDRLDFHQSIKRYEHLNASLIGASAARAALDLLLNDIAPARLERHLRALGARLYAACSRLGISIVGPTEPEKRAPHLYILKLRHPSWEEFLRSKGIYVSHYRLGIRVSFGFYNNEEDVDVLATVLKDGLDSGIQSNKFHDSLFQKDSIGCPCCPNY